jgi:hypothetical protein
VYRAYDIAALACKGREVATNFGVASCEEELEHLEKATKVREPLSSFVDDGRGRLEKAAKVGEPFSSFGDGGRGGGRGGSFAGLESTGG